MLVMKILAHAPMAPPAVTENAAATRPPLLRPPLRIGACQDLPTARFRGELAACRVEMFLLGVGKRGNGEKEGLVGIWGAVDARLNYSRPES